MVRKKVKKNYSDKLFNIANTGSLIVLFFIFAWPMWFVIIASFSHSSAVASGKVFLWPVEFSLDGYSELIEYAQYWRGYANTIFYSVVGTIINLVMSICCAYPLSIKEFIPQKIIMGFCLITMYVSGGMIPLYLVVKSLGLVDTRLAMIIPGALHFYYALIIRNYFMNSIPNELREASMLDGANAAQYLIRVVIPLSKPVLAVVGLYYFVGHWNDYGSALLYIYDRKLYPLQSVLKNLLVDGQSASIAMSSDPELYLKMLNRQEVMKYGTIVVSMIPVLIIYPFIQKFFVKGALIGSVKG